MLGAMSCFKRPGLPALEASLDVTQQSGYALREGPDHRLRCSLLQPNNAPASGHPWPASLPHLGRDGWRHSKKHQRSTRQQQIGRRGRVMKGHCRAPQSIHKSMVIDAVHSPSGMPRWAGASTSPSCAFVAVAKNASMTVAAKALHLTRGGISQQIKRLEDAFECRLFERAGRQALSQPGQTPAHPHRQVKSDASAAIHSAASGLYRGKLIDNKTCPLHPTVPWPSPPSGTGAPCSHRQAAGAQTKLKICCGRLFRRVRVTRLLRRPGRW